MFNQSDLDSIRNEIRTRCGDDSIRVEFEEATPVWGTKNRYYSINIIKNNTVVLSISKTKSERRQMVVYEIDDMLRSDENTDEYGTLEAALKKLIELW